MSEIINEHYRDYYQQLPNKFQDILQYITTVQSAAYVKYFYIVIISISIVIPIIFAPIIMNFSYRIQLSTFQSISKFYEPIVILLCVSFQTVLLILELSSGSQVRLPQLENTSILLNVGLIMVILLAAAGTFTRTIRLSFIQLCMQMFKYTILFLMQNVAFFVKDAYLQQYFNQDDDYRSRTVLMQLAIARELARYAQSLFTLLLVAVNGNQMCQVARRAEASRGLGEEVPQHLVRPDNLRFVRFDYAAQPRFCLE